jgi:hypothetical protein
MAQDIPAEAKNRAQSLFGDLIEGRWENVRQEFDAGMRHADGIGRGWANVTRPGGTFKGMGTPSGRRSAGCTVVNVPLAFRAGDAAGRIVLGRDGKVTGLKLQYPRRRRLDPRPVHVFTISNGDPEVAKALNAAR